MKLGHYTGYHLKSMEENSYGTMEAHKNRFLGNRITSSGDAVGMLIVGKDIP
jgi:hypothetical protein